MNPLSYPTSQTQTPDIIIVDLSDLLKIFDPNLNLYHGYSELAALRSLVLRVNLKKLIEICLCQSAYDFRDSVVWELLEDEFPDIDSVLSSVDNRFELFDSLNHLVQDIVLAADRCLDTLFFQMKYTTDYGNYRFSHWVFQSGVFVANRENRDDAERF